MRRAPPRQQSGELLYFLSGFLTLQLEIHNYFSSVNGIVLPVRAFQNDKDYLLDPYRHSRAIAQGLLQSRTPQMVYESIVNVTTKVYLL